MAFVKGQSGNPKGRPTKEEQARRRSKKDVGEDSLQQVLRKLKPLSNRALAKLGVMLEDDTTTETTRLRAIIFILNEYKDLTDKLYIQNEEDVDVEEEDNTPMFALHVLPSREDKQS